MGSPSRSTVLFDASPLRYLRTGLGQFTFQLLSEFAHQDRASFELMALVHPRYQSLVPEKIGVVGANWFRRHSPAFVQKQLYPHMDLWHMTTENTKMTGVPSGTKVILTIHGLHFLDEETPDIAKRELDKVQQLVNRADAITTVSHFTAGLVKSKLNLDGKPVEVIHNGILHAVNQSVKPAWAPPGKFFFSVGTFFTRKNFHVLLPMMQQMPSHFLVLAGDFNRPYGAWIKGEIQRLHLEQQVIVPGEISDAEKQWLYENGEALLFPSLSEGFGIPVVEAFASGTPVFSSRAGSLPEVGQHYAHYWDHFDPTYMAEVVQRHMKAETVDHRHARKVYARQFSWANTAKQYLDFYQSVIGKLN